jgi:uncharacterized surface protein with fasciclin (FAS1) repeats
MEKATMKTRSFRALAPVAAIAALVALAAPLAVTTSQAHPAPRPAAAHTQQDIVTVAQSTGQFQTLLAAAQAAGLVDTLRGAGPYTVFAPTDAAFAALPAGTVERLLRPENRHELRDILTYHVVPGRIAAADLAGQTAAPVTANGQVLAVDGRSGVRVNGASVIQADVAASNGVIHVIDEVLLPF